jgi:hypothetical protein
MNMIAETLSALASANGGTLTPALVLAEAKRKDSPIHDQFDWTDKTAANKYRLEQARKLIRSVKVEITNETRTIKAVAYARDPRSPHKEQGYVDVAKIKTDEEKAQELLLQEFARAAAALERAHGIAAHLGLEADVAAVMERVNYMSAEIQMQYKVAA